MGEKPTGVPDEINIDNNINERSIPDELIAPEHELREYNFERMKEWERFMIPLVEKLKEKIENSEYSALLSDDAGGRIPTLVLDRIFKAKSSEKINTYFLAGGQDTPTKNQRSYKETADYLKKMDFGKKLLVVTQFIIEGGSLKSIGRILKDIGVENFDFATMTVSEMMGKRDMAKYQHEIKDEFNAELVFNEESAGKYVSSIIRDDHEDSSGIQKHWPRRSPLPKKEVPRSAKEYQLVAGRDARNITDQEFYNKSREDVRLMAERIIAKVWPQEK